MFNGSASPRGIYLRQRRTDAAKAQTNREGIGTGLSRRPERPDLEPVESAGEEKMHWQIEPLILPVMVATLLLIAAMQAHP